MGIHDESPVYDVQAQEVVELLSDLHLNACDSNVCQCAAEALGSLPSQESARALMDSLVHGSLSVGDVRATALHSVVRLLEAGKFDETLENLRELALAVQHRDH